MNAPHDGYAGGDVPGEPSAAPRALADLLNRVLDRGVVLGGDVTLSVAGVDLVFLRLSALLTSVATAREKLRGHPHGPGGSAALEEGVAARLPSLAHSAGMPAPLLTSKPAEAPVPTARPAASPSPASVGEPSDPSSGSAGAELPDALAGDLARVAQSFPERLEIDPEAVQRDLARLVLTIVELLRRVVEHQAVRRMDDPELTEAQVERMGIALDRLEQQMREMKRVFGLADDDLNIDLGDLGTLL
jgi:hypothetical protein